MRELKTSEIEGVSGGIMTRPPENPLERLVTQILIGITLQHFRIKLPKPMPQPK